MNLKVLGDIWEIAHDANVYDAFSIFAIAPEIE